MDTTKQKILKELILENWVNTLGGDDLPEYTRALERMAKLHGIDLQKYMEEILNEETN